MGNQTQKRPKRPKKERVRITFDYTLDPKTGKSVSTVTERVGDSPFVKISQVVITYSDIVESDLSEGNQEQREDLHSVQNKERVH